MGGYTDLQQIMLIPVPWCSNRDPASPQGMTPGCGCSGELVTEVAKELQQRCSGVRNGNPGASREDGAGIFSINPTRFLGWGRWVSVV